MTPSTWSSSATRGPPLPGLSASSSSKETSGAGPGTIDRRIDFLPFHELGDNGFFLIGNCGGLPMHYGVTPDAALANDSLENSSLTVALVETISISGDVVTGSEVVLDTVALTDGGTMIVLFRSTRYRARWHLLPGRCAATHRWIRHRHAGGLGISDFDLGPDNTPHRRGFDGCAPSC